LYPESNILRKRFHALVFFFLVIVYPISDYPWRNIIKMEEQKAEKHKTVHDSMKKARDTE